jgi:putative addiction module killer protein
MFELRQTDAFASWLKGLKDRQAQRHIAKRLLRLEAGHFGDVKPVGEVSELRIHHGPGYRIYFIKQGQTLIILLTGGTKRRQDRDIEKAARMAKEIDE